jgi:hypothetical protein
LQVAQASLLVSARVPVQMMLWLIQALAPPVRQLVPSLSQPVPALLLALYQARAPLKPRQVLGQRAQPSQAQAQVQPLQEQAQEQAQPSQGQEQSLVRVQPSQPPMQEPTAQPLELLVPPPLVPEPLPEREPLLVPEQSSIVRTVPVRVLESAIR